MSKDDVKAAVKKDLRAQLRAERYFLDFCKYVDPKHPTEAPHMKYLSKKLQQVAEYVLSGGERGIPRLMIFMPPRYWKSQTASRKFPAWLLGKNPDLQIILTSYGADLATGHSKGARDLVKSERYDAVFGALSSSDEPVVLDRDSKAAAKWEIDGHMGGMQAAGVGGGITGFGANLFIVDDPVKGRKEVSSQKNRDDDFNWYQSTAYTRIEKGGAVIVIMTRWDVEDLAGKLLTKMVSDPDADQWDVVFMPAIALDQKQYPKTEEVFRENLLRGVYVPMGGDQLGRKPGEALWKEQHEAEALRKISVNMGDFDYVAQFLQMPRLAVGNFFDDGDFKIVDKAPGGLQWFRFIDLALGKSKTSDFNATGAVAFDDDGNLYIRDMLKIRDLEEFFPACKTLMLSEDEIGTIWAVEDVAFQHLVLRDFLAAPELAMIPIMGIYPAGDKVSRAQPWRLRAKQGKVFLVRAPWILSFIRTAAAFGPNARHDDEIDSVSGGVQLVAEFPNIEREGEVVVYEERVSISAY